MGLFKHGSEKQDESSSSDLPPAYPAGNPSNPSVSDTKMPVDLQPSSGGGNHRYACLLLASSDKIRSFRFPPDVENVIGQTIAQSWSRGLQNESIHAGGGKEWKLKGRPWYGQTNSELVDAKALLANVIGVLSQAGWGVVSSVALTKLLEDKDTIFFHPIRPVQRQFFALSFDSSDKIRVVSSPGPQIPQAVVQALQSWPGGTQAQQDEFPNCVKFKLKGNPWTTVSPDNVNMARLLACEILEAMDSVGFELVASVDMLVGMGNNAGYQDIDTWFFGSKI